jgi:hypothetical protein
MRKENLSHQARECLLKLDVNNDDSVLEFFYHFHSDLNQELSKQQISDATIMNTLKTILDPNRLHEGGNQSEPLCPYIFVNKYLISLALTDNLPSSFTGRILHTKICQIACNPEHIMR